MTGKKSVREITDELVRNLEQSEMNISEIIKGGSLGHGTALADESNLDLVVYSRNDWRPFYHSTDIVYSNCANIRKTILDNFEHYLHKRYGKNYKRRDMTQYALQFTLYGQLEVDLLPSPHWDTYHDYLNYMAGLPFDQETKFYGNHNGEATWMNEFFQTHQPNEVREFTRRAKEWRNEKWPKRRHELSSFLLGLLVAEAYHRSHNKDPHSVEAELKLMVRNHRNLQIWWSGRDGLYDSLVEDNNLLTSPCILDPVNPLNNVYWSCRMWDEFADHVHTLDLTKPVMTVGAITDELVRNLEQSEMNISEIIKGGSLGHGTALADESNLDLVVYLSRDFKPAKTRAGGLLNKFHCLLAAKYGWNYCYNDMTPYALQFTLYGQLEVDLLPSRRWRKYSQYLSYIARQTPRNRRKFQCTEAKWEKHFFQFKPNRVKEYIKIAKAWRNQRWPKYQSRGGRPKSFLLGLLVIEAYRRSRNKDSHSVEAELKHMVRNHRNLQVWWSGWNGKYDTLVYKRSLLTSPCILDPVNPFNNVYVSGIAYYRANSRASRYDEGDGNWTEFVRDIDTLDLTISV